MNFCGFSIQKFENIMKFALCMNFVQCLWFIFIKLFDRCTVALAYHISLNSGSWKERVFFVWGWFSDKCSY